MVTTRHTWEVAWGRKASKNQLGNRLSSVTFQEINMALPMIRRARSLVLTHYHGAANHPRWIRFKEKLKAFFSIFTATRILKVILPAQIIVCAVLIIDRSVEHNESEYYRFDTVWCHVIQLLVGVVNFIYLLWRHPRDRGLMLSNQKEEDEDDEDGHRSGKLIMRLLLHATGTLGSISSIMFMLTSNEHELNCTRGGLYPLDKGFVPPVERNCFGKQPSDFVDQSKKKVMVLHPGVTVFMETFVTRSTVRVVGVD
ncbi:hypothetical protein BJ742DRAFT_912166 [Cladochytrium replicatum]|nr:hypothetical protein BJ742DRAFT_912166 [Cladochytrium replicatum]